MQDNRDARINDALRTFDAATRELFLNDNMVREAIVEVVDLLGAPTDAPKPPRYLITHSFSTANGGMGNGLCTVYEPKAGSKPSVFKPQHVVEYQNLILNHPDSRRQGYVAVMITSIHRYED